MSQAIIDAIVTHKVIAIVRGVPSESVLTLAQALERGGIKCIEVTFDQSSQTTEEDTLRSIRLLSQQLSGRIFVGAGTVMSIEQVHRAAAAGAEYIISPNADKNVIEETKALGKVSIPGAMTPTEAASAYQCGADMVKLFPAGLLGPGYVRALCAPLKHIPFMAVGGITPENCTDFLSAGALGVGVGGNLVSPRLVADGHFEEISTIARSYAEAVKFFQ